MKKFAKDAALLFLALRAGDLVNLAAGITTTPDNTRKRKKPINIFLSSRI